MDSMSPQQQEHKRHLTSQSLRRQSAPSLVITRALTRSKTLSRESFLVPPCPETCPLVQSVLGDSADRSFLLHGHVQLKTGMQTQDRHLFLFNDILVVAKAKSANHFKLKARVCVCEMWTAGCMDEVCEGTTNPERSFVMGWPTCNCAATFSSTEQKERWLSLLKSLIKEEKEKEEPKTIPLRVYGKGINSFAVIKTLPVSNSDSTNEVIRLALQQFGVIGHVKDYQLWVISKRDNAPYPLIGHEFPFSVHMSHVRHAVSQGGGGAGGREAAAPSVDRQALLQTEQLRVNKQCQFILRPRPMETQMQQVAPDSSQKPFKRRRSLITWAFWRGSASHLNELSLVEAPRGCLFGRPLSSVCVEDSLPRPVMDMLAFLYHEGSWTRGIFRRPAGARAIRELRDSLDAGEFQLPLTRDHVFVIAGVFKDFLRSIPGSLLCCELHEDWMDVLEDEEEEEEEQVQDIHRMIGRLPKENTLLLRFLLAVLHGIQGNAAENQMTTFNLSVCIAPSMLWPPGAPCSPEVEGEGTKKVCELVKFMIEHCQEILEEDPCSLFGGPPRRSHTDDMGPGPLDWTYPLTDSSYDSLENELDDSSGGSPAFCSRGRLRSKPLQGSLDSVLTFSDNDHDADPDTHRSQAERDPGQDAPVDTSSTLVSRHRQRRSSEPAIAYLTKFGACTSGSSDGLTGEDEDGEEEKSSQDSLRSLSSDHTCVTRRAANSSKTCPTSNGTAEMSPPCSLSSAPTSSGSADQRINSSIGQPKDLLSWGTLKGCRGLHPNCWLKKDQRLTLTQQDNWDKEQDKTWQGASERSERAGGKQQRAKTSCTVTEDAGGGGGHVRGRSDPFSSTSHHHSARSPWLRPSDSMLMASAAGDISIQRQAAEPVVKELKQPSPSSLHRHPGPSLSLFKRHKSHSVEEEHHATLHQRRASEPGCRVMDRASVAARARLPSDPGLKVSEVDSEGAASEARFCLSPRAAKAVRDYFSSHPDSNPKSSQQVALALVESHREWLKRCSDPTAEPDYDQLLFAEESYV